MIPVSDANRFIGALNRIAEGVTLLAAAIEETAWEGFEDHAGMPGARPIAAAGLAQPDLHIEADQLFAQVGAAAEAIDVLIARNACVAQDQGEYQRRFDKLNTEHVRLLADYDKLLVQISDLENRQAAYRYYKEQLATLDLASIEFTPYLWHTLVDHADITITFTFRDGSSRQQLIGK